MKLDVEAIRKDFPILDRVVDGRKLVYLDSAATSQKPQQVIDALVDFYSNYNANIHRGIHSLGAQATEAYEGARKKVAAFIGAGQAREVIFTRNTTEAINLVASTWGATNIGAGDEILLTPMEHHSNLVPWQMLAQSRGAKLVFAELKQDTTLDLESVERLIGPKTKLVALTQMSNVLGTILPVKQVCDLAHAQGALVLVDGAQSVPHLPVNVTDLGCDFLAFSMHKMLGPTGVGVLWGKAEILEQMPPYQGGGNMISSVWRERAKYNEIPYKFEAGTPNIADVIASGVAIDYLQRLGMDAVRAHEIELVEYALAKFAQVEDIEVLGTTSAQLRGGVISFNLKDMHPHDLGQIVNEDGIAIRVGHHCCQPLMRDFDVMGTARASFYIYTTEQEIDLLVASIQASRKVFKHVARR